MEDFSKKFAELAKASQDFQTKYAKFSKADSEIDVVVYIDDLTCCVRSLNYQMEWIAEAFARHLQGHLPAVKSTEQLQRAVKVLGLDGEYDVVKPEISARGGTFYVGF